ncbi:conserved hypothetical protein [Ricinus communis]|uniref:Uncharacterized protein n=1 Tax=Ricinus communis TaxID=3988 RepID=B9S3B8_RICCO|nr:conserved hypothetical protein [Ricinus communis]
MEKGILTVQWAENSGCAAGTVSSVAPWLLTVGASNTDHKFIDKVVLGNGFVLNGLSVNSFTLNGTMFPVVYGQDVSRQCTELNSKSCTEGCVDKNLVKGKIVINDSFGGINEAYKAGALGAVGKPYSEYFEK